MIKTGQVSLEQRKDSDRGLVIIIDTHEKEKRKAGS